LAYNVLKWADLGEGGRQRGVRGDGLGVGRVGAGGGGKECGMEVRYVTPNLPAIGSAIESQTTQLTSLNQQ
jgi:hypothetical protein